MKRRGAVGRKLVKFLQMKVEEGKRKKGLTETTPRKGVRREGGKGEKEIIFEEGWRGKGGRK